MYLFFISIFSCNYVISSYFCITFHKFQRVCLLQWHSINSLQWSSKAHSLFFSIFYIFTININENEFFTYSDTKANDTKKWKTTINMNLSRNQFNSFFLQIFVCLSVCRQHVIFRIFAINQNASINKNSKNSNSRNLKQHTFAKSISLCCFCFCLILKYRLFYYINLQIFSRSKFSTRFSFSWFYIFCFRISFSVFAFTFSHLSHLFRNFLFQR